MAIIQRTTFSNAFFNENYYTPRFKEVERGVYWYHLVRLSVCPSVRLWTESCPLCIFINTHRIHFIFAHQATSEGVSRVMPIFLFWIKFHWRLYIPRDSIDKHNVSLGNGFMSVRLEAITLTNSNPDSACYLGSLCHNESGSPIIKTYYDLSHCWK